MRPDRVIALFQIFDVAFFVPGAVVFLALWGTGSIEVGAASLTAAEGVLQMLLGLGAVYAGGLLIHGAQRFLFDRLPVGRWGGRSDRWDRADAWYRQIDTAHTEQLALYFWYLRATSWNLAVALTLSCTIVWHAAWPAWPSWKVLVSLPVAVAVLVLLGLDFDRALDRAVRKRPVA